MAFMHSWQKQGGKNPKLNEALKDLSSILLESNATVSFHFIPSSCNPADFPSRTLSDKDCMLSESAWLKVDGHFGSHTLDMMSLDSNAQKDASGNLLKHFTPIPDSNLRRCKCVRSSHPAGRKHLRIPSFSCWWAPCSSSWNHLLSASLL